MKKVLIVDDRFVDSARRLHGIEGDKYPTADETLPEIFDTKESISTYLNLLKEGKENPWMIEEGNCISVAERELADSSSPQDFFNRLKKTDVKRYEKTECLYDVFWSQVNQSHSGSDLGLRICQGTGKVLKRRVLDLVRNPKESYDLTRFYKAAGGKEDIELLILGEPKLSLNSNDFFYNPYSRTVAEASFDINRAASLIDSINPDVLLVDMNFPIVLPDEVKEQYEVKVQGKNKHSFKLKAGGCPETRFPAFRSRDTSKDYYLERAGNLQGGTSLSHSGGVILGRCLADRGTCFSFWTNDYGHGYEAIVHAYTLDLLSEEDVRSLVKRQNEAYHSRPEERQAVKSDSGNIIIEQKHLISYSTGDFEPDAILRLERVIEIASKYQNKDK